MCDDPDVIAPLKFLRAREIVHFQRFGEALRIVEEYLSKPSPVYKTKLSNMQDGN
jgi:spore coat protein JC